jgi:quinolinate synthase
MLVHTLASGERRAYPSEPEARMDVPPRAELPAAIDALRRERNAVVLAHYYQDSELQDLADHVGDSLQLARAAQRTEADVILFCGVHFMAETAKIMNPTRTVVVPDLRAGCSLADSAPASALLRWKAAHPDHQVVSYINCTAATKALSDVIVTSSNARQIIEALPRDRPILFAPDRNLGAWLVRQTGRPMDLWPGTCIVHETFSEARLLELVAAHPGAEVLAHPECEPSLLEHATFVGSTSALLDRVARSSGGTFIVATEAGILHAMARAQPSATLLPVPGRDESCACNLCPYMRLNTLEGAWRALATLQPAIEVDEDTRVAALRPLVRMMEMSAA